MLRAFDPKKFLELAKSLMVDGNYERESRFRTTMGRIYYAAFLVALHKLHERGIRIEDKDKIHQAVIETYKERHLYSISDGLDELRDKRVDADYHMTVSLTVDLCRKYATLSEYVISLIEQIHEIS